jgi:hypothetical protein
LLEDVKPPKRIDSEYVVDAGGNYQLYLCLPDLFDYAE